MNRYKILSIVLAVLLLAALVKIGFDFGTPVGVDKKQAVLENIFSRKSVRSYTDRAVSREQLDTLVRAAMAAPTGRDMRPWKFIVIDDKTTMDSLAAKLPYAKMLREAQAAIVVCGDLSVKDAQGNPSTNWTFDCSAATENLLLAAEAMGLGAVWTAAHPYKDRLDAVNSALSLPEYIIPLNVIPIGWPEGNPQPKDKFNPENVHYNRW